MTSMEGRVVLVTGANSGIGFETTKGLVALGAHVVMVCRDAGRCEEARKAIEAAVPAASLETMLCDLGSLAEVRALAGEFRASHDRLHVLVNNAAIIPYRREVTVDGNERQMAVNHLSHFLLTHLLWDIVEASAPSRVLNLSSGTHPRGRLDLQGLQSEGRYRPMRVYATTKLMNILFTRALARRIEGTGVTANALSPGFVNTRLSRDYGPFMRWLVSRIAKPQEEGGATPVWVASSPELDGVSGRFFRNLREAPVSKSAMDDGLAKALWHESERLVGLRPEERIPRP